MDIIGNLIKSINKVIYLNQNNLVSLQTDKYHAMRETETKDKGRARLNYLGKTKKEIWVKKLRYRNN